MAGILKIFSSDVTPVELTEITLPTTAEGAVSAGTKYNLKNTGTSSVLNSTYYAWIASKYTNTAGTPLVSVTDIVRSATSALQISDIVDEILSVDSVYTVYSSNYKCWYGGAAVNIKKNDIVQTTGFSLNYGLGKVTFTAPLAPTDVVKASFSYKNARPGTYALTFPSTSTCKVNGGSSISIVVDGVTGNTNVIAGLSIVFSSGLTTGDTATIIVSDLAEYIEVAPDSGGSPGTYTNIGQINLGTITSSSLTPFWVRLNVPSGAGTAGNDRKARSYSEGVTS